MINACRTTMVILVALAFGACGMMGSSKDRTSQQSQRMTKSQTAAGMKAGELSPEARLLGFLNLANKGDLEGGRLARIIHEYRREAAETEARRGFSEVRATQAYLRSVEETEREKPRRARGSAAVVGVHE